MDQQELRVPANQNVYIVRPIYNLLGMGLGAKYHVSFTRLVKILIKYQRGTFGVKSLKGLHYTIDYEWGSL